VGDMPVFDYLETRARTEAEYAAEMAAAELIAAAELPPAGAGPAGDGVGAAAQFEGGAGPEGGGAGAAGLAAAVAAANEARSSYTNGRASVDVAAALQRVLSSADKASLSGSVSGGSTDGGPPAAAAAGQAKPPSPAQRRQNPNRPPLEPVHRAVGVGHAWSVSMPPGVRAAGLRPGAGGGGGKRAGGGGGGGAK
jgi:hypothetical protein